MPSEVAECVVANVVAAFGDEDLQFAAAVAQSSDPVSGHQVAPRDVQVDEVRATLRQRVEGDVGDGRTAAEIQLLQLVAVQ